MPNVVGVSAADAEAAMQRVGLGIETRFRRDRAPKDTVIEQLTRPGVWQPDGEPVVVVVSRGPKAVTFANVVGQPVDAATTALQGLGFVVDANAHQFDEQAQAGTVLASDPAGEAPPDSVIKLTVSDGPAPRTVPDVGAGGTFAAAAAALDAVQLSAAQVDEFNDTVPAGQVLGTDPAAGAQVPRGTAVSVRVSKGPDLVAVPASRGPTGRGREPDPRCTGSPGLRPGQLPAWRSGPRLRSAGGHHGQAGVHGPPAPLIPGRARSESKDAVQDHRVLTRLE